MNLATVRAVGIGTHAEIIAPVVLHGVLDRKRRVVGVSGIDGELVVVDEQIVVERPRPVDFLVVLGAHEQVTRYVGRVALHNAHRLRLGLIQIRIH